MGCGFVDYSQDRLYDAGLRNWMWQEERIQGKDQGRHERETTNPNLEREVRELK